MTYTEFEENLKVWAENRNIHTPDCSEKQFLKVVEEWGETVGAYLKKQHLQIIDGLGDTFVTLQILAIQNSTPIRWGAHEQEAKRRLQNLPADSESKKAAYLAQATGSIGFLGMHNFGTIGGSSRVYLQTHLREAVRDTLAAALALGQEPAVCMQAAWDEIKSRTGKTINGTFIKS